MGKEAAPRRAPAGAQVFPGFRPSNAVDASRDSVAGYVDLEADVHKKIRLGLAGRFEHYSDFGGTADGKLTVRFEPHGVSSGGDFRVGAGGLAYLVSVDRLTGRVSIARQ